MILLLVSGGDCSAVASELKQVVGLCGSEKAFAALKRDGTVTTWGNKSFTHKNFPAKKKKKKEEERKKCP